MNQKYEVLRRYVHERKSFRQIAREVGIHRETVRKYVRNYEEKRNQLIENGECPDTETLIESLTEVPTYRTGSRPKRKLTPYIEQRIGTFLAENQL